MASKLEKLQSQIIDLGKGVDFGDGLEKAFGRLKIIPLEMLVKANWNYKKDDAERSAKLVANIKRNGQFVNIAVRRLETGYFEVIDGNHRYDSLKEVGYTRVLAYDFGKIPLTQAQRIAIEVNETKFEPESLQLAQIVSDLKIEFGEENLLETLPFNEQDLDLFDNMLELDWNAPDFRDPVNDDGFTELKAALPDSAYEVYKAALKKVRKQLEAEGHKLNDETRIRHGQVIELLAAEFLAGAD